MAEILSAPAVKRWLEFLTRDRPSEPHPGSFPLPFHGFYLIARVGRRAAGSSMVISGGTAIRPEDAADQLRPIRCLGLGKAEARTDWGRQNASSRNA